MQLECVAVGCPAENVAFVEMDRHEFHRIMHPRDLGTYRRAALVEGEEVNRRRGTFPTGSGVFQLPRASFMMEHGLQRPQDAAMQSSSSRFGPAPTQPTVDTTAIVLRAVTHPTAHHRSRNHVPHEAWPRQVEGLTHRRYMNPVNGMRMSGDPGVNGIQHLRSTDCYRHPAAYFATPRSLCPPPRPGRIARSLVGRPVMQFRGRSTGSERYKRSAGNRRHISPTQVVDLVGDDEETSSELGTHSSHDGSSLGRNLLHRSQSSKQSPTLTSSKTVCADGRAPRASTGDKSWQSRLPAVCLTSNGMMQMDLHPCRTARLETAAAEERTYEDGVSPVDLDSLSIAQGIGINGPTFLPPVPARVDPHRPIPIAADVVLNLISDDEEKETEPPPTASRASSTLIATEAPFPSSGARAVDPSGQCRVMECLQPLLNAIEIVSAQREHEESLPPSPPVEEPLPVEEEEDSVPDFPRLPSDRRPSGRTMRSLNDISQEMAKKAQKREKRRGAKLSEEPWSARAAKEKVSVESEETGTESGSVKRVRPATTDEEESNPYRKPYRKSSRRRSLNDKSSQSSPGEDPLWNFLNDGLTIAKKKGNGSAPLPTPEAAKEPCPNTSLPILPNSAHPPLLKSAHSISVDDQSWSTAKSWIQDKTEGQLQQLVQSHSLCGLAHALLEKPPK